MSEPRAITSDELRDRFMDQCRDLVDYWAGTSPLSNVPAEYGHRKRLNGLLHSLLGVIDGISMGFPCSLDLVCRPHPDDKQFHIGEGEDWVEDGTVINGEDMLHELLYDNGWDKRDDQ